MIFPSSLSYARNGLRGRKAVLKSTGFQCRVGGGFHDKRACLFPTTKRVRKGAFVESLLRGGRSGLSQWYVDHWCDVGNMQRNRRVPDCVAAAETVVIPATLIGEDPFLSKAIADAE